jgi:hypothetical protein
MYVKTLIVYVEAPIVHVEIRLIGGATSRDRGIVHRGDGDSGMWMEGLKQVSVEGDGLGGGTASFGF